MITVLLNGEEKTLSINNLLKAMIAWEYTVERAAVAVNGEFIPRSQYQHTELADGDKIDVVGAVGGG